MPDGPIEPPVGPSAGQDETQASRSLSEILEELAVLSYAQQGEASEMRNAVSELSRALASLFEMIRTDRHDSRARIAQLERELAAAREQLAALGAEPVAPPAPNDFDQLRAAAERLRLRTEQLVRDATANVAPASTTAETEQAEAAVEAVEAAEAGVEDPSGAVAAAAAETEAEPAPESAADSEAAPEADADITPMPGGLRVISGAAEPQPRTADLDVESDLPFAQARAAELPAPIEPAEPEPAAAPADESPVAPELPATTQAAAPQPVPPRQRPEPIPVAPRATRPRGFRPRRRRIDARKLTDVEPAAALGSMVGAVDQLWTAGCPVDLVVAFTDGGALRVSGGDRSPLRVEEVEPGAPARCTVTATRRQLVPLFGRLELTGEESAPLIHGSRRDADLLVGWIDRAQRLQVEPL